MCDSGLAAWALAPVPHEQTAANAVRLICRAIADKISIRRDIPISVSCPDEFPGLVDIVAGNLLLVIQEAIHNVIKHAKATSIDIRLDTNPDGDRVDVSVRDNGIGFDVSTRPTSSNGHFGIEGMEQCIEQLSGTLVIASQLGVGATINIVLPMCEFCPMIA